MIIIYVIDVLQVFNHYKKTTIRYIIGILGNTNYIAFTILTYVCYWFFIAFKMIYRKYVYKFIRNYDDYIKYT